MRWIYDKKILPFLLLCLIVTPVFGLRMTRPTVFKLPWTDAQLTDLNNILEELFNMQKGRYELDIVTTTKSNANNGEAWIFNDSGTYKLQFMAGDAVKTITP